ncbi:MAG: glycosyltransferase 87 family protein [Parvularculaceae bacterium]|nr:glycosyltransferase 87 family protein [Parvularculaceae bacterium]
MSPELHALRRALRLRFLAACAVASSAIAIWIAHADLFRRFWFNDLSYFWAAGRMWGDGVSPYVDGYIARANALIPTEHIYSAFYYAPAIRPLAELLALFPMETAANLFLIVNIAALVLACGLLGKTAARFAPRPGAVVWAAAFLFVACVVLRHPLVVVAIGQITILLLLAFSLFLYAIAAERPRFAIPAILLLLLKPHFGIPVVVFAALHAPLRRPLVVALVLYGALTLYGLALWPEASLRGFFANIAAYADHPRHDPAHASGLGQILASFGLRTPTAVLVCLLSLGAVFASGAATPRERVLAAAFLPAWTLFVGPNHMEDFAVLAPLLLVAILGAPRRLGLIAFGLFLVGRGHEMTAALPIDRAAFLDVRTAIHTIGLGALVVAAAATARPFSIPLTLLRRRFAAAAR